MSVIMIFLVAVLQANEPVDLLLLPGILVIFTSPLNYLVDFKCNCSQSYSSCIFPGLAFDRSGRRIGRGGG